MMTPAPFYYRRWLLLSGILLSSLASSLQAERFQAGLNAVDREHYATAFRAWKGLAEDGAPEAQNNIGYLYERCLLYTSPSPRDRTRSRMPSSA